MRCSSPASLAEGGGDKGAGGGLGIKPQYNLAYDESNKSLAFYPLTPLRLLPSVPSRPLPPSPPSRRGGGVKATFDSDRPAYPDNEGSLKGKVLMVLYTVFNGEIVPCKS